MLKKLFLGLLCLVPIIGLAGCGDMDNLSLVKNNMSEITNVYFFSDNEDLKVSLASGQRENDFKYDGKSTEKVNFALIVAQLNSCETELCKIIIDGEEKDVLLEFNYRTGKHMADLETKLTGNEKIEIVCGDLTANLVNKSKDFGVSSEQALQIGVEYLKDFIEPLCQGKNFNAEAYLRVMDVLTGQENGTLWLFSVLSNDGQIRNIIISTSEPNVLADDSADMI